MVEYSNSPWLALRYIHRLLLYKDDYLLYDSNRCRDAIEMAMEYWGDEWSQDKMQRAWEKAIEAFVRCWGKSRLTDEVVKEARRTLIEWCGYEESEVPSC